MIIPVLCFTCGKTLGDKYDWYQNEVKKLIKEKENKEDKVKVSQKHKKIEESLVYFDDIKTGDILDKLGLTRSCCRRHMLGHVDMMKVI
jgi:DNA-directed RNA polymerase subunit N (RpoN/RPB10)